MRRHPVNCYPLYKQTELEKILDKLEQSVSTRAKAGIKTQPEASGRAGRATGSGDRPIAVCFDQFGQRLGGLAA